MNRIKTEKREKTSNRGASILDGPRVVTPSTLKPKCQLAKPIPDASKFSIYFPLMFLKINRLCNKPTGFHGYLRIWFFPNSAFHPAYPVYPCLASFAAIRRRSPTVIDRMDRMKTEKREKTTDSSESIHHRPHVITPSTLKPQCQLAKPIPDASRFSIYFPLMFLKINRLCNKPTGFHGYLRIWFFPNSAFHPAYPVYPCLASFAAIRRRSPTAIDRMNRMKTKKREKTENFRE